MRSRRTIVGSVGLVVAAVMAAAAAVWQARPPQRIEPPARADAAGPPAVAVTDVQLGKNVGLDKRISVPADAFAPDETIYASVVTEGGAEYVRLTSRWQHEGKVVAEFSQGIQPSGHGGQRVQRLEAARLGAG